MDVVSFELKNYKTNQKMKQREQIRKFAFFLGNDTNECTKECHNFDHRNFVERDSEA